MVGTTQRDHPYWLQEATRMRKWEAPESTPEPEWEREGDYYEYEFYGYKCYAVRHPSLKHWCGYIEVPAAHPWRFQARPNWATYDSSAPPVMLAKLITWDFANNHHWLGFDCAGPDSTKYQNIEYVRDKLFKLASDAAHAT